MIFCNRGRMIRLRSILLLLLILISAEALQCEEMPKIITVRQLRNYRAQLFTSFHVAQYKIYIKDGKGSKEELAAYQKSVAEIQELQTWIVKESRISIEPYFKNAYGDIFLNALADVSAAKIRTSPPFTKRDLNDVGQLMERIDGLISLPITLGGP